MRLRPHARVALRQRQLTPQVRELAFKRGSDGTADDRASPGCPVANETGVAGLAHQRIDHRTPGSRVGKRSFELWYRLREQEIRGHDAHSRGSANAFELAIEARRN